MTSKISILLLLGAMTAPTLAAPPATAPADQLLTDAAAAVAKESLPQLAANVEAALKPMLADLDSADMKQLTRLAALREFARYFGRIEKPDEASTKALAWLTEHPRLLDTLMMAVSDADAPDRVLAVLAALREEHDATLEAFPDLAAAMCVVWDGPPAMDPEAPRPDTDRPVWLFRYLSQARQQLRFDSQQLPWELAVYVADNECTQDEVAWARTRYLNRGSIGGAYFDVPYDIDAYYGTAQKRIDTQDYTLQNLMKFGGTCGDQAYFATQVARSIGVPACWAAGLGGASDVGHAWVGFLDTRGKKAAWNFTEGRYPEGMFWKGAVRDPRTREMITDSDVSLLGELIVTPSEDRLASAALVKVADLTNSIEPADVYIRAIDLSPGNREAWTRLAKLGADLKLTESQSTCVMATVGDFAAKQYPDFAFEIVQKLNSGRGTDQQRDALKQMRRLFQNRADLQAAIALAEGDLHRDQKRNSAALTAYGDILTRHHNAGPIVIDALDKIEGLLREHNDVKRLAGIYRQTWMRLPQPASTAFARGTPYYIVGQRYLALLQEMGEAQEASRVSARLDSIVVRAAGR